MSNMEGWQEFIRLCAQISDPEQLNDLYHLFFTIEEREVIASRFLIIKALLEGKMTQRKIAEKYHVSIPQITRGSNALKIVRPEFKNFLVARLEKEGKN